MILRPFIPTSSTLRLLSRRRLAQPQPTWLARPCPPPPAHLLPPRPFSTTSFYRDDQTHYQVLGVDPSISHSDLKKRFYVLSRETHPDLHPNDPDANTRFQSISESYSVLSNPDKRKKYDRDVMGARARVRNNEGRGGTYAGSRPASGLSRRRSAFRGPPPSYFRGSGTNEQEWTGNYGPSSSFAQSADFDPSRVFKTQTIEDERRDRRREAAAQAAIQEMESTGDFWVRFVVVTVIVVGGVSIGSLVVGMWERPIGGSGGGMVRGDGTRRGRRESAKDA